MVEFERHAKAMEKLAALVSVRERCEKEARMRLARAGFSDEEVDDALEAALRCGIVSDERYTRAFIRGKTSLGWGRKKICTRLAQDGIGDELVAACEDEFGSPDDEYERALHELDKRSTRSKNPYPALMRRLVGKGYSYDIAKRAVKEHLGEQGVA